MRNISWEAWSDEVDYGDDEEFSLDINTIMIRTPLGLFSQDEPMSPGNMFECWIGHTDFNITSSEVDRLNIVEGVEVLKIMSRYRFFIGVGKLFTFSSVRPLIESALKIGKSFLSEPRSSTLEEVMEYLQDKERWIIYQEKDGTYSAMSTDKIFDPDYDKKVKLLQELGSQNIITSDE